MASNGPEKTAATGLILREMARRTSVWLREPRLRFGGSKPRPPHHLVALAADRRLADPMTGRHLLAGQFNLGGRHFQIGTASPFNRQELSARAVTHLHGFRWLRHLSALENEVGYKAALHFVKIWIDTDKKQFGENAYTPLTIAHRLSAWCQNSGAILQTADATFERQFIRTIIDELQTLRSRIGLLPPTMERLLGRIAVVQTSLALDLSPARRTIAFRRLTDDFDDQILPDGGHISRNPAALVHILINLNALLESCQLLDVMPPEKLIHAADRMMPALNMLIHSDGELAGFNGVGYLPPDELALALRVHEAARVPNLQAPYSGYERLSMGQTTIISDVGDPPPIEVSNDAHAGTLAMEMSSGRHRYIINIGVDLFGPKDYRLISRQTVSHSTATINDVSSASFATEPRVKKWLGDALLKGPGKTRVEREDTPESQSFRAAHNGYMSRFGIIHERMLTLQAQGSQITGKDRFFEPNGQPTRKDDLEVTIRFHLHPTVNPILDGSGHILLTADRDDSWAFYCDDVEDSIIESVYFSELGGPRKTKAIALTLNPAKTPEITWEFRRTGIGRWSQ